ncbi:MAG: hypothetical protein UDK32_01475, partial [Adlercreutzia sp.]|nr:hypothetical protein [Adlercreutzia sp.]
SCAAPTLLTRKVSELYNIHYFIVILSLYPAERTSRALPFLPTIAIFAEKHGKGSRLAILSRREKGFSGFA